MFSSVTTPKSRMDYVLAALAGLVLAVLISVGLYGSFTGFLQSRSYLDANEWVALISGFIGAGCALYLLLEMTDGLRGQLVVAICLLCGLFSVFAVSKGLPAAVTTLSGKPMMVQFEITGFDWGSKRCPRNVIAKNPGYEDFQMCVTYFTRLRPEIGRTIEIRGMGSAWGIVREQVEVKL